MAPGRWFLDRLEAQRGFLFPWVPVFLAGGIGAYLSLPGEPGTANYAWITGAAVGCMAVIWAVPARLRPPLSAALLVLIGFLVIGLRANLVAEPVLAYRYYGPIQGRITKVDRSYSDKLRLTLDQVVLARTAPEKTPLRVRVSLHGQQGFVLPEPGLTVILTGHLSPPSPPVEPGGFDFQRMAWFDRLGAVGYTRTPVLSLSPPQPGLWGLWLHRLRMRISAGVQVAVPGRDGAFAAAIMTGDRSGMDKATLDDLRASNLAHLLAISGLHMGLLTGFIFTALRSAMALAPPLALRIPVKKIAALAALISGAGYLALSGGNVATERAFLMVAVMFIAVMLDRRALTLRAVALAAIVVLAFRPESVAGPGFQMSFAATTALVAVFGGLRNWQGWMPPRVLRPVLAVVISSAVAGFATAPVAAAHFNRIADYGLLANLLSVPLMGLVVMPGAVLAAVLAPLGLGWVGLAVMKPAIHWILAVSHWVADLPGASSYVVTPSPAVLPLFALGALWVILWQGRARLIGLLPVCAALIIWIGVARPPLLISETGGLIGVLTPAGRALNKPKGEGFAARSWLENDGDGADQFAAAKRTGFTGPKGNQRLLIEGLEIMQLSGRGAVDRVAENCRSGNVVIVSGNWSGQGDCTVIDRGLLSDLGAVAAYPNDTGLRLVGAKQQAGKRLWNWPGPRQ